MDNTSGPDFSDTDTPAKRQANTVEKLFSRKTTVSINIAASAETIWNLLTDADGYKSWNTTVSELTGSIAPGNAIKLRSKLAPERLFKLKVKEFDPNVRLSWGDAMGTRVFTLSKQSESSVRFTMSEKIGGPIFPLFAKKIPPFDESFNQFAADLKSMAEEMHNA